MSGSVRHNTVGAISYPSSITKKKAKKSAEWNMSESRISVIKLKALNQFNYDSWE